MKGTIAAFDTFNGRRAAAFVRDGQLEDLLFDPPEGSIAPGTIFRARVGRPMKGQGGVFLETPEGRLFLRQAKGLSEGTSVLAQTTTFAERGKAPPATTKLTLKSRYALATPGAPGVNISRAIRDEERRAELHELAAGIDANDGVGVIIRSAAADGDDQSILADIQETLSLATSLVSETSGKPERLFDGPGAEEFAFREWVRPDQTDATEGSFERHGIDGLIDDLRHPEFRMTGGGSLFIEPTRALVAIDVNTGNDTSPAAGLKTNIAAVRALPRMLRLLGLGGQIVVDMAPMPKRDRIRVEQQIKAAFRGESVETAFVGWTPLGHAEFQRKRERVPVLEVLT